MHTRRTDSAGDDPAPELHEPKPLLAGERRMLRSIEALLLSTDPRLARRFERLGQPPRKHPFRALRLRLHVRRRHGY